MKHIEFSEVLAIKPETVAVQSYGYEEISLFGGHFEPFSHKRTLIFDVEYDGESIDLTHSWLNLNENPKDLFYMIDEDGVIYVDDPELWAK